MCKDTPPTLHGTGTGMTVRQVPAQRPDGGCPGLRTQLLTFQHDRRESGRQLSPPKWNKSPNQQAVDESWGLNPSWRRLDFCSPDVWP